MLFILTKYVIPPINKAMTARQEAIRNEFAEADEAKQKAKAAEEEFKAQIADARHEAARIREDAKDQGAQIVSEAREQAQVEAARPFSTIRSASTCACSRCWEMIWAPWSRASSRMRAASGRASASWAWNFSWAAFAFCLASSASANSLRIASWRAVIALLIGGMTYFARMKSMIANANSSTKKVALGTRKLLASRDWLACHRWIPLLAVSRSTLTIRPGRRRTAP